MNQPASPGSQLGPLNPGNVVSAALKLYRDRFKTYLHLAWLATLWIAAGGIALGLAVVLPAAVLGAVGGEVMAIVGGLLGLVLGLIPLLYGMAKYYKLSSVVGRLCFRELIGQPETSLAARRQVEPKLGQFLLLGFLLLLAYGAIYLVAALAALVAGGIVGGVTFGIFAAITSSVVGGIVGGALGGILGLGVFLVLVLWLLSRLLIADVVLAIELDQDGGGSLSRSWELTRTSVWRIQVVLLATFLIQLPIISVTNYIPSIALSFVPADSLAYGIGLALSLVFSLLGSLVILPLWQAVKGVLYYDLRSRREGLDLKLRQSPGDAVL
ncbi:MAG: hypothetical protein ACFCVD_19620 [Nodosilinea sp.]